MTTKILMFDPDKTLHTNNVKVGDVKIGESIIIAKIIATKQPNGKFVVVGDKKTLLRLKENNAKMHPTSKTQTCRLCGTQLHKYNRVKLRDGNDKIHYPRLCKNCEPYLTEREDMLSSLDLTKVPRSILTLGIQGSPSGRSLDEIRNDVDANGVSKVVRNIVQISRANAEYLARFVDTKGTKIEFGRTHTSNSTEDCFTCYRMKEYDSSMTQTTLKLAHDSNRRDL